MCLCAVDSGGTVVLVSQDGIQRPPFRFPKGGHLLQFLTCLETGLLPHGQLDPPLWSQRGKVCPARSQPCFSSLNKGSAILQTTSKNELIRRISNKTKFVSAVRYKRVAGWRRCAMMMMSLRNHDVKLCHFGKRYILYMLLWICSLNNIILKYK